MCRTEAGCPIEDIATDVNVQKLVGCFFDYKTLQIAKSPAKIKLKLLKERGAYDLCPEYLLSMENVWSEFAREKKKEYEKESERKRKKQEYINRAKKKAHGK